MNLMERPKALQERIFTKLFEAAEIAKFTKVEYDSYEESLKVYRDWKSTIHTAEYNGEKKGIKKGREEKAIEMARKMKAKDYSIDEIIELTNLTEEQINAL